MDRLASLLGRMDRRGYKAYKQIQGDYRFPDFVLRIDHVQGDPFADPSRCRVFIDPPEIALPQDLFQNPVRRIALEDFLGRRFAAAIETHVHGRRGAGKSGEMSIAPYGQQVLERNALLVRKGEVEVRFRVGLPADGRSVNARQAKTMLLDELPRVVETGLLSVRGDLAGAQRHLDSVEDQQCLRARLHAEGLVAFIADGSILPRSSGVDDRPLQGAIPFRAPDSLAVQLDRPHGGPIRGLGIPRGVTLIVGGGFHGKSTLLHAVERGVYDHIPGDGRERVVADPSAFKVRAEDGRAITGVDISPFINNLPQARDTRRFTTQNASGSTSQAASIMEALAASARTLLIDEDTSATNFMIRDARMQALVAKDKEPITPLVQRIRDLERDNGVSVILVMGGSSDFFATADTVIMLDNYIPRDVTAKAKTLAQGATPLELDSPAMTQREARIPRPQCLSPRYREGREKIQAFATRALRYGRQEIDLSRVEQLVDSAQVRCIGYLIRHYGERFAAEQLDLVAGLGKALDDVASQGLDRITPFVMGNLAVPRLQELVAAVNRMRGLELIESESGRIIGRANPQPEGKCNE
jgi:predicted ABC-class ATPase